MVRPSISTLFSTIDEVLDHTIALRSLETTNTCFTITSGPFTASKAVKDKQAISGVDSNARTTISADEVYISRIHGCRLLETSDMGNRIPFLHYANTVDFLC